jgi:hypothetical protein
MSMTNTAEEALLDLLFLNTDWANIGDASGLQNSATAGSFYISLLESDPGESGSVAGESTYTDYARVAVARSGAGFSRTNSTISNTGLISFPPSTGGTSTVTHFGIHTASGVGSTGNMVLYGELAAPRTITSGNTPQYAAGQLTVVVD